MDSQNSTSTLNYIVLGTDLSFAKTAQQILSGLQAENPQLSYRVFPGTNKEKLLETLDKYDVHSILVEEEYLDSGPDRWLKDFRESIKGTKNKDSPILFVTVKTSPENTKNLVRSGFADVIIKPVDPTLFIQKLALANAQIKMTGERPLFIMEAKQDVDLGFSYKTLSISEFGMTVQAEKPLEVGAVLSIYAGFLENQIAAQIRDVKKISDNNYQIFVLFLGVTPAESQYLRKWMKQEYAHIKAAA